MGPPSVGGSGGAFTAPTPGSAAAPSAPAAPSASAPPADVAKPTPARPAVAGGVAPGAAPSMPLGTQDPAAAAALHAARQFFGFMHQGMAAGGFGVPPGAFGAPPDARQGAPVMSQHVDPSEQPQRGATPGVAADGAVTYNRKDKRYARDERRSFVFFPSLARAPPGRHEERLRASSTRLAMPHGDRVKKQKTTSRVHLPGFFRVFFAAISFGSF